MNITATKLSDVRQNLIAMSYEIGESGPAIKKEYVMVMIKKLLAIIDKKEK